MRPLGFKLSADRTLTACTYVDNNWTVAHESASAVRSMEAVEQHLKKGLGARDQAGKSRIPRPPAYHPRCGSAAGIRAARGAQGLGPPHCRHCTRWPPRAQLESEVDRVQRHMIRIVTADRLREGEDPAQYAKRTARQAGRVASRSGLWSERHCTRVVAWSEHLERERNQPSWASVLYRWRGEEFLMQKRASQGARATAGRTAMRAAAGHVHMRGHDGVRYAKDRLAVSTPHASAACVARTARDNRRASFLQQSVHV